MYDAIVVGARCAGSPTAMLLARKGYRVLLVDKASFPSDTMSTHFMHPPAVNHLRDWGLLGKLQATGCPTISEVSLHFGKAGFSPPLPDGGYEAYCPRRLVLDKILVDAAVEAGADLRERVTLRDILFDGDTVVGIRGRSNGATVEERARIVIGADGMRSTVATSVRAPRYCEKPSLTFAYYTYFSGIDLPGFHIHFGEDIGVLVAATNDGMNVIGVGGPGERFHEFRTDIEGNYLRTLSAFPFIGERVREAKREDRFVGTGDQPNFFRKPFGPGWALVGDAGYHRDFITGLRITDAFRDAELLSTAIDDGFSCRRPLEEALADYEQTRNEIATPLYELTTLLASGPEMTPELIQRFMAFGQALERC